MKKHAERAVLKKQLTGTTVYSVALFAYPDKL